MLSIMSPNTIPKNYQTRLREFASSGYRILAIASKKIKADWKEAGREEL
jgi:magnesium-transporting ATPase (P-type)